MLSRAVAMPSIVEQVASNLLFRYALISAVALGTDVTSFLTLLAIGVSPILASAAGYMLGIGVHWLISSRAIFQDNLAAPGAGRLRQKFLFAVASLAGLVLTTTIVGIAALLAIDPRLGKLAAMIVSFFVTWCLRRWLVFDRPCREL